MGDKHAGYGHEKYYNIYQLILHNETIQIYLKSSYIFL